MGRDLLIEQAAREAGHREDAAPPERPAPPEAARSGIPEISGISEGETRCPRPVDGLSKREHRERAYRARAQRVGTGEHTRSRNKGIGTGRRGRRDTQKMTVARLTEMTQDILELTHGIAMDEERREVDRKYATTSYSIALDKWLVLTGRPSQIIQVGEAEAKRPAVSRLAAKVVRMMQPVETSKSA